MRQASVAWFTLLMCAIICVCVWSYRATKRYAPPSYHLDGVEPIYRAAPDRMLLKRRRAHIAI